VGPALLERKPGSTLTCCWLLLFAAGCVSRQLPAPSGPLSHLELAYQDLRYWDDQTRLMSSLVSDTTPAGLPAAAVAESLGRARKTFALLLNRLDTTALDSTERAARAVMQQAWHETLEGASTASADVADSVSILSRAIYADYGEAAGRIIVGNDTLNRLAILGRLGREKDRETRHRLFLALAPVWQSINGDNSSTSRYRALVRLRRATWEASGSPIEAKAPAFGLSSRELEAWLTGALRAWRAAMPDTLLEPWDWYYRAGEASRLLTPRVPRVADLIEVNQRFYTSIGAGPYRLGIHYDLLPRAGKDPVAFTDFGSRRRWGRHGWTGTEPWVFTAYLDGGFDNLGELLHESGHGIHIAGIATRPAWNDWPDNDTFTEALADVPAMELYEPSWQHRFLGDSAPLAVSLRARYAGIMMDMAWALFEIQVHRTPDADPNRIWSDLTRDYLGMVPHPEISWWAMRGQLINAPGYLVNYAFGAFITADIRARAASLHHPVAANHPDLYPWLQRTLYRWGRERASRTVLEEFLGRPVRPEALLADLTRMQGPSTPRSR
jgi:hypothetical protein